MSNVCAWFPLFLVFKHLIIANANKTPASELYLQVVARERTHTHILTVRKPPVAPTSPRSVIGNYCFQACDSPLSVVQTLSQGFRLTYHGRHLHCLLSPHYHSTCRNLGFVCRSRSRDVTGRVHTVWEVLVGSPPSLPQLCCLRASFWFQLRHIKSNRRCQNHGAACLFTEVTYDQLKGPVCPLFFTDLSFNLPDYVNIGE